MWGRYMAQCALISAETRFLKLLWLRVGTDISDARIFAVPVTGPYPQLANKRKKSVVSCRGGTSTLLPGATVRTTSAQ